MRSFCCCHPMPPKVSFAADPVAALPFAHGKPPLRGVLKEAPGDFLVDEILAYPLDGAGEHLYLRVRKRGLNTVDVARELALWAGVEQAAVGFAGLKDRHAVTTQYFSIRLPRGDRGDALPSSGDWQVLDSTWHRHKLRRGELAGNRFVLCLRHLQGDRAKAEKRLQVIRTEGVPNFFGPQRFGGNASNLEGAHALLTGRLKKPKPEQRRMLLSAARSHLFNQVLAARVRDNSWNQVLPGEVLIRAGDRRQLIAAAGGVARVGDAGGSILDPSGPLPGKPGHCLNPEGEAARFESDTLSLADPGSWCASLAQRGVPAGRRALRVVPEDFAWKWSDTDNLVFEFRLPPGCYATSVVRELMLVGH